MRDVRLRPARRARAALAWAGHPIRSALQKSAELLDAAGSAELANLLLRARPDRVVEVATGTAVHALLRGEAAVFDVLTEAGLLNKQAFAEAYYAVKHKFVWGPPPASCCPDMAGILDHVRGSIGDHDVAGQTMRLAYACALTVLTSCLMAIVAMLSAGVKDRDTVHVS